MGGGCNSAAPRINWRTRDELYRERLDVCSALVTRQSGRSAALRRVTGFNSPCPRCRGPRASTGSDRVDIEAAVVCGPGWPARVFSRVQGRPPTIGTLGTVVGFQADVPASKVCTMGGGQTSGFWRHCEDPRRLETKW